MANLGCDGFEQYPDGDLDDNSGQWVANGSRSDRIDVVTDTILGTPKCIRYTGSVLGTTGYAAMRMNFPTVATLYAGSAVYYTGFTAVNDGLAGLLVWGSTTQLLIGVGSSGELKVRRTFGTSNNIVLTGNAGDVTQGSRQFIEIECTSTTISIYVGGMLKLAGSFTSIGNINGFGFAASSTNNIGGGSFSTTYFDDCYANDGTGSECNSRLGEISVLTLFPNFDEIPNDWIANGSFATGWQTLSQIPPVDTDFVSAMNAGDVGQYGIEGFPVTVFQIFTTWVGVRADKDSSATAEMRVNVVQNGVTGNGTATFALTEATFAYYQQQFLHDPDTGVAWNPATFAPAIQLERTA